MKLRAKSDHRIREFGIDERNSHPYYTRDEYGNTCYYKTLKEVADNWEDVPEEPETYYYVSDLGNIESLTNDHGHNLPEEIWYKAIKRRKEIGNYFETKEEAEKAVEKFKAWKRLKDNGFKFKGWRTTDLGADKYYFVITAESDGAGKGDLDLLFGGEE